MTFAEVELACKGYETRMARVKEVPRLIAAYYYNAHRKGGPAIDVEKIFPLYTDKKRKVELITKEEFEDFKELRKRIKWQSKNLRHN